MKFTIVYFSGTGNTRFITQKIGLYLERDSTNVVEIITIEEALKDMTKFKGEEMILGIGYPVYDLMPPKIVTEFLKQISEDNNIKGSFIFSTYSSYPLDSNFHVIDSLQKKGIPTIAKIDFKAPGASAFMYMKDSIFVRNKKRFSRGIEIKINKFVHLVLNGEPKFIKIKFNPLNHLHQKGSKWLFGKLFYQKLAIDEKCIVCGACVNSCPEGNLRVYEKKINILDAQSCMKCMRCVQICPKSAIDFNAKRKGNYKEKDIKNAYNDAQ